MVEKSEIAVAVEQVVNANEVRASYWDMLASLYYREVSNEKLQDLAQVDWAALASADEDAATGYDLMARAVKRPDARTRQSLACDYAHTFLAAGSYDDSRAVPYESVFTSEDGLLMQEARDGVYRAFCAERLGVREYDHEPEDHFSFECEFMAVLARRCNEALAARDWTEALRLGEAAAQFHADHIMNWADDLCASVERVARTTFYQGLAQVTRAHVHAEAEAVQDVVAVLRELAEVAERPAA